MCWINKAPIEPYLHGWIWIRILHACTLAIDTDPRLEQISDQGPYLDQSCPIILTWDLMWRILQIFDDINTQFMTKVDLDDSIKAKTLLCFECTFLYDFF